MFLLFEGRVESGHDGDNNEKGRGFMAPGVVAISFISHSLFLEQGHMFHCSYPKAHFLPYAEFAFIVVVR